MTKNWEKQKQPVLAVWVFERLASRMGPDSSHTGCHV